MNSLYLYSFLSMGSLAALLAIGLGFASRAFKVSRDERIDEIEDVLPGINCGACGYAGCSNFAAAIVTNKASINACPVTDEKAAEKLAKIMEIEPEISLERKVAQVLCKGGLKETRQPAEYRGIKSCKAAKLLAASVKSCQYACLGFGDCAQVCPYDAIIMNTNGLPEIDPKKCTACNKCVLSCPQNIIILAKESIKNNIRCSSHAQGKNVAKICEVGCIACGLCVKVCPVEAIVMENNLAVLDYTKCINCGLCAQKCPTKTIEFNGQLIDDITITDNCVGCSLCAKKCPVQAIQGELKQQHMIDSKLCIKCGLCANTCKVDNAITVKYKGRQD